ncbi:MAG: YkgJ family cysteine cluster protein [Marinirhabdus sp.]
MQKTLQLLPGAAAAKRAETQKCFKKLKQRPPKNLDALMQGLHTATFKGTDCLSCANCCKTTGPLFTKRDIARISKHLKIKEKHFITTYLKIDEDNDHVLQRVPCAFLGDANFCNIYSVRPKACREFPHTNRKKFQQITDLTLKNVAICPAAFTIVEAMKKRLKETGSLYSGQL